jgi:hypothetical protein
MSRILFLSASDRWNLGDLLFPVIARHKLAEHEVRFENVGLRDFSVGDGFCLDCRSIRNVPTDLDEHTIVIVGGGEVLGADFDVLYSFIYPSYAKAYPFFLKLDHLTFDHSRRLRNWLIAKFLGERTVTTHPYLASGRGWVRFMLPVGGRLPRKISSISNIATWRARELGTKMELEKVVGPVKLAPDPVSIVKQVHPGRKLRKGHIAIQLSRQNLSQEMSQIAEELRILKELGYKMVPVLMGKCPRHFDQDTLGELCRLVDFMEMGPDLGARETLDVLSSCEAYVGTSLHGAIISFAYGGVVFGLSEGVPKLRSYIETWFEGLGHNLTSLRALQIHEVLTRRTAQDHEKQELRNNELTKKVEVTFMELLGEIRTA